MAYFGPRSPPGSDFAPRSPPIVTEMSLPLKALKKANSSRSVSISRPWWASRSRPRNGSQLSLASSLKSTTSDLAEDVLHKREASGASGQLSDLSSALRSRSRRRRSSGLYLNEPRVTFAPTPSPQPNIQDNCVFLPPLTLTGLPTPLNETKDKEDDAYEVEDPSELSSEEDDFAEIGLYKPSLSHKRIGYTPSQSIEGHPTPSQSMCGHRSTSFSEEGSTTTTSYFVGSSPSMSIPRKPQIAFIGHKKSPISFEKPRRVISRAPPLTRHRKPRREKISTRARS